MLKIASAMILAAGVAQAQPQQLPPNCKPLAVADAARVAGGFVTLAARSVMSTIEGKLPAEIMVFVADNGDWASFAYHYTVGVMCLLGHGSAGKDGRKPLGEPS